MIKRPIIKAAQSVAARGSMPRRLSPGAGVAGRYNSLVRVRIVQGLELYQVGKAGTFLHSFDDFRETGASKYLSKGNETVLGGHFRRGY